MKNIKIKYFFEHITKYVDYLIDFSWLYGLPKGTLREFSRWSSWSSGHISLVVGGIDFPDGKGFALSFPNCGWWYNQSDPLSSPQQIRPFPFAK